MRRPALFFAAALQLTVPFAAIAQTQTTSTTQTTTQASGEPGQIGEHVSGVAPEHPREEGADFGECVSELAITGECPHEHEEE